MSKKTIEEHLCQYYGSKALPAETLARLTATAQRKQSLEGNDTRRGYAPRVSNRTLWTVAGFAVAATFLVTLLVMLSLGHLTGRDQGVAEISAALTEVVAKEIALNHNKRLNVEFRADNYAALRRQMDKLDFATIAPARLASRGYRLLGARYCSLQGQIATQVKLKDKKGRVHTLYQTRSKDALAGVSEGELDVDGLRLNLWREGGLFFGLASPRD